MSKQTETPDDLESSTGVTIKELKEYIKDWPETNQNGEPTGVWIENGRNLSSPCRSVEVLNLRTLENGTHVSDLCFAPFSHGTYWQPIATAPKDITIDVHNGNHRFTNVRWCRINRRFEFRAWDGGHYDTLATHWMPLPEPP